MVAEIVPMGARLSDTGVGGVSTQLAMVVIVAEESDTVRRDESRGRWCGEEGSVALRIWEWAMSTIMYSAHEL